MEIKQHYNNPTERQEVITEWEDQKYRMLHDNFDADWKVGDKAHGTMTFTDNPPSTIVVESVRDLAKEIDELKAEVEKLKAR